jgi:hypothetical protein
VAGLMETASKEAEVPAKALTRAGPGSEFALAADATNDCAGAMAQLRTQTAKMLRIILRSLERGYGDPGAESFEL